MNIAADSWTYIWPVTIFLLIAGAVLSHWHFHSLGVNRRRLEIEEDDVQKEILTLQKEIAFYEQRKKILAERGEHRKQLARVAHQLGGLLDPPEIHKKLLQAAAQLFPRHQIQFSSGQTTERQSYLSGSRMAVPVTAQRMVIGVLNVTAADRDFAREDLRLLESLANLASLALDNGFLFSQVKETALRDGLTGLLTHRAFQDQLEAQILEASRYRQPLAVILADVDHFKSVNDNYGHQAGDQILQGFAHILARNVREVDIVARYGGEEFIVLLLQSDQAEGIRVAEQIRQDLAAQSFLVGRRSIQITGSFGVASFPVNATSAQQLIREADQRLYRAKQNGRNQVIG